MSFLHHFHRAQEFPKAWCLEQPVGGVCLKHFVIEELLTGGLSSKNATLSRPERASNLWAGTQVKSFFSVDLLHTELDKTPELVFFCWPPSESTDSWGQGWGKWDSLSVSHCGQLDTTSFETPCSAPLSWGMPDCREPLSP